MDAAPDARPPPTWDDDCGGGEPGHRRGWYDYWERDLRENYYALFDVERQIHDAEANVAALRPGRSSEPLWQSDLYKVPTSPFPVPSVAPRELTDEELYLLTR